MGGSTVVDDWGGVEDAVATIAEASAFLAMLLFDDDDDEDSHDTDIAAGVVDCIELYWAPMVKFVQTNAIAADAPSIIFRCLSVLLLLLSMSPLPAAAACRCHFASMLARCVRLPSRHVCDIIAHFFPPYLSSDRASASRLDRATSNHGTIEPPPAAADCFPLYMHP